jgi:hypothetical protein
MEKIEITIETGNAAFDDEAAAELARKVDALGLTMEAAFVPFSQSRHAGDKMPSLNWKCTIKRNGRDVLTCDYGQGAGHCPADKLRKTSPKQDSCWPLRFDQLKSRAIGLECETGRIHVIGFSGHIAQKGAIPTPSIADVVASLARDADVLNYATYEEWGADLGYDPDSRKGEAIYRLCLSQSLAMRAAIGDEALSELSQLSAMM